MQVSHPNPSTMSIHYTCLKVQIWLGLPAAQCHICNTFLLVLLPSGKSKHIDQKLGAVFTDSLMILKDGGPVQLCVGELSSPPSVQRLSKVLTPLPAINWTRLNFVWLIYTRRNALLLMLGMSKQSRVPVTGSVVATTPLSQDHFWVADPLQS